MKKPTSLTEIVKLEKAIEQRWGSDAVSVPVWDQGREAEFLEQLKAKVREQRAADSTTFECDGFLLDKKLVSFGVARICPICESYLFYVSDEMYMNKFECCHLCYIKYIEGREEKWDERKRELLNESHKKEAEGADSGRGTFGRKRNGKTD